MQKSEGTKMYDSPNRQVRIRRERADDVKRDRITVTPEGLGEAYETKIKSFFDE